METLGDKTMSASNHSKDQPPRRLSNWLAYPLALLVWEGLPWAISLLSHRYGWIAGRPGTWNLLGLIPILIGTIGLLWGLALHTTQSSEGIEWELDKSYLLKGSLYNISRNPMYLSELILLFGWIIFYGSISLFITFVIWYMFFNYYAIPQEERILEAHFGEAYREYQRKVRRWL
jgi:protein-S-isoprenylcysteine O-methyltransferase Ste14